MNTSLQKSSSAILKTFLLRRCCPSNTSIVGGGGLRAFTTTTTTLQEHVDDISHYKLTREPSQYSLGKHRSNALELIQKQPIIEVEGDMAVCDGGGGALGHPLEYIKVGDRADYQSKEDVENGVPCIYCGLRYRKKKGGH